MKITFRSPAYSTNCKQGFASILLVISSGLALMLMLLLVYEDTSQSQDVKKMDMLSADYKQREDAFLRALISIVPNYAMRGMRENSLDKEGELSWEKAIDAALTMTNAKKALPDDIASTLGVTAKRQANAANTTDDISFADVIIPFPVLTPNSENYPEASKKPRIIPGVKAYNETISSAYPPHLIDSSTIKARNLLYPIISNQKKYGSSVNGGIPEKSFDNKFGLIPLPNARFTYRDDAQFIAKHNWWTFNLNFSAHQKAKTLLQTRNKQYIFSIYEVPAQLAINASSIADLGSDALSEKLKITGGIFATEVQTSGSFSSTSISSRKKIKLSGTSVNGQQTELTDNTREEKESKNEKSYITSAGNSGRLAIIPLTGGEFIKSRGTYPSLEDAKNNAFYDNTDLKWNQPDPANQEIGINSLSSTSWDYYSRGAVQCQMRIIVDDNDFKFSFLDPKIPENTLSEDQKKSFIDIKPYVSDVFITINLKKLKKAFPDQTILRNCNSLYVKHVGSQTPHVIIEDADDLSEFEHGFSFITNSHLIFSGDINTLPKPQDNYTDLRIPLSIFAPSKQFGKFAIKNKVDLKGQISSNKSSGSSKLADIKSGDGSVNKSKIEGSLSNIENPNDLPPINFMNWMVTIREKHPSE